MTIPRRSLLARGAALPLILSTSMGRATAATPQPLWDAVSFPVGMAFDADGALVVAEGGRGG